MLSPDEIVKLHEYYQQTFETAMGSPVSGTVANLVMENVEERESNLYLPLCSYVLVNDVCTVLQII